MFSTPATRKLKRLAMGAIASLFITVQLPLLLFMAPTASADSTMVHGNSSNANSVDTHSDNTGDTSNVSANQASSSNDSTQSSSPTTSTTQQPALDFSSLNQSTNAPINTGPPVTDPDVTLCHATGSSTNPYVSITISAAGAYNGHYSQRADDIIPAFTFNGASYGPLNMTTANQTIYNNGCQAAAITPPGNPPAMDADVTLCHATGSSTNPYVQVTVSAAGAYNGHYTQHATDIIPAFTYNGQNYSALNMTTANQAIYNNGCQVVTTTPSTPPMTGGRGGGMPVENTTLSLFSTAKSPHVLGASIMTGGVGAGELVNTGSSVLLNVLAGLFILGATAVVTVISRRGRQALPQSDTSWVLTK